MISWRIWDRINESMLDFHEIVTQLDEDCSPRLTDRSKMRLYSMNVSSETKCNDIVSRCTEHANLQVLTNGINILHSTTAPESMLQPRLPELCQESSALYNICLTFQLSLSATDTPQFFEYFDTSLREFRSELARSTTLSDGTLTAGLLLCSIGVSVPKVPVSMYNSGLRR